MLVRRVQHLTVEPVKETEAEWIASYGLHQRDPYCVVDAAITTHERVPLLEGDESVKRVGIIGQLVLHVGSASRRIIALDADIHPRLVAQGLAGCIDLLQGDHRIRGQRSFQKSVGRLDPGGCRIAMNVFDGEAFL